MASLSPVVPSGDHPLRRSPPTSLPQPLSILMENAFSELRAQLRITLPLAAMNLAWFAKTTITTAFLGRLGKTDLAGGALGLTFANVTGFSVLSGISAAMEPICGQAFGARNFTLLRKTLFICIIHLLLTSILISFFWLHADSLLLCFGQQEEIIKLARIYIRYLLPDLFINALLCPLKVYLSSQSLNLPIFFTSVLGVAFHLPINICLYKKRGFEGVSMAIWITDLAVVIMLATYVSIMEGIKQRKNSGKPSGLVEEGSWMDDSLRFLKLAAPCCLTACLEWWCFEILILLAGRLPDANKTVAVLAVVLNLDSLLYSVMLSLATSVSTRVSNELGSGHAGSARRAAMVSLVLSLITGFLGGSTMVAAMRKWGMVFTSDREVVVGVRKLMPLMAAAEVVNFPLAVCGGVVRGTGRPAMVIYAALGGFYSITLPLAWVLSFKAGLGLEGLLMGFLVGSSVAFLVLKVLVSRINWEEEACKAQRVARVMENETE